MNGRVAVILWVILIALVATGTAFSSGQEEGEAETIVLRFMGTDPPETREPVISAFEAEHENIDIQYEQVPFADLNSVIQTRVGRGDATPDIYYADQPRVPGLAHRGFLLEVNEFKEEMEGTVFDSAIEASSWNGDLYAFPVSTSTNLLFYNKDLLDAAGLEYPSSDPSDRLTWDEAVAIARQSQEAGAEWGLMVDQVNRYFQLQPLFASLGGGTGLTGPRNLTPDVTNEGWVRAMEFYQSIFADGLGPRGVPPGQTPDLFANGQLALFVGGPWWLASFRGRENLDFGVAPFPYAAGGEPATPTDAWSWGINPNSEHTEAAKEFLRFVSLTEEGARLVAQDFPVPPVHRSIFDGYYSEELVADETISDLMRYEIVNTSVHRPRSIGYVQFESIMGEAFEDIQNGADVRETLNGAAEELESAFSRLQ